MVLMACQTGGAIESLKNRTEPSHIEPLTPPGWRLRADMKKVMLEPVPLMHGSMRAGSLTQAEVSGSRVLGGSRVEIWYVAVSSFQSRARRSMACGVPL